MTVSAESVWLGDAVIIVSPDSDGGAVSLVVVVTVITVSPDPDSDGGAVSQVDGSILVSPDSDSDDGVSISRPKRSRRSGSGNIILNATRHFQRLA